jgi:hypothetical protein
MTCINQFGVIEHFLSASVVPKHQVWASTDSEVVIFVEIVEIVDTVSNGVISLHTGTGPEVVSCLTNDNSNSASVILSHIGWFFLFDFRK